MLLPLSLVNFNLIKLDFFQEYLICLAPLRKFWARPSSFLRFAVVLIWPTKQIQVSIFKWPYKQTNKQTKFECYFVSLPLQFVTLNKEITPNKFWEKFKLRLRLLLVEIEHSNSFNFTRKFKYFIHNYSMFS